MPSVIMEDKDLIRILRKETGFDIKRIVSKKITEKGEVQVFWRTY